MPKAPPSPVAPRLDLPNRPRRNRKAEWTRRLTAEHVLTAADSIWPLFSPSRAKRSDLGGRYAGRLNGSARR